jgi:hypothetical protein
MNVDPGQLRAHLQAVIDAAHDVLAAVGAAQDHLDTAQADEAAAEAADVETEPEASEPAPADESPADETVEPAPAPEPDEQP